jgi:hypothetical protein
VLGRQSATSCEALRPSRIIACPPRRSRASRRCARAGPRLIAVVFRLADSARERERCCRPTGLFRWYRPSEIVPALLARNDYLVPTFDSLDG